MATFDFRKLCKQIWNCLVFFSAILFCSLFKKNNENIFRLVVLRICFKKYVLKASSYEKKDVYFFFSFFFYFCSKKEKNRFKKKLNSWNIKKEKSLSIGKARNDTILRWWIPHLGTVRYIWFNVWWVKVSKSEPLPMIVS